MRTMQKARRVTGRKIVTGRGVRQTWNPMEERPLIALKRRRTRALLSHINATLRSLRIAVVPANPWHILAACAGEPPNAKTQRIADALETTVPNLSDTVAIMEREMLGQGESHWDAQVLMQRLRAQREKMDEQEKQGLLGT